MSVQFSEKAKALVEKLKTRYPEGRQKSAILPVLHLAQAELGGWLSPEVMDYVASLLSIKPIEVYEVATFYSMLNTEKVGKFKLEVCRTSPCCLNGAEDIIAYLEKKLGIQDGETTADGLFTLKSTECLGACGYAPMMQVGEKFHEFLTPEKVDQLLADLKSGKEVVKIASPMAP
ncbi:MAG: NAD(P)H-dependent oxidoreductase subunit E [Spirochaetia bacterium]|nr:NAD(P)H-dependent oxidoreductase subunit E [Spirochaetia bacterium]